MSALLAVAALLMLAGCAPAAASGPAPDKGGQATPATIATPSAPPQLSWRQVQLPAQVMPHAITGFAVSPVDGRDAWLCVQASAKSPEIWATRDAGLTWIDRGALPPVTSEQGLLCELAADENDSHSLAAIVCWGSGEAGTLRSASLVSTDGGAHWSRIPGDIQLMELGRQGAITYAVLHDTAAPMSNQQAGVVASADGLRTWHTLRPASLAADDSLFAFWLRPSSMEIVAASIHNTLWRSTDGGAHWTRVSAPNTQTALGVWLPARAQWMFCGWPGTSSSIACSTDLGKTWSARDGLPNCFPDFLLPDGTLLAACPPNGGDGTGTQTITLYQMPLDASTWASLGTLPEPYLYAAAATGQLWCGAPEAGIFAVATLPA